MKILKFFVVVLSLFGLCTFSYGYLSKHEVFSTIKELYNRSVYRVIAVINDLYRTLLSPHQFL